MSFTAGSSAKGLAPRHPVRDPRSSELLLEVHSKADHLLQRIDSQESAHKSRVAKTEQLRTVMEDILSKMQSSETDRDAKLFNLMEQIFELRTKLFEASKTQSDLESMLEKERGKVENLLKEIEQLKVTIETLESDKSRDEGVEEVAKGTVAALEMRLKQATMEMQHAENEKHRLQAVIGHMKTSQENLENEANRFTSKMKELQRKVDLAETEVESAEKDIRKIRREKDGVEVERDDLESKLTRKNIDLQEERSKLAELTAKFDTLQNAKEEEKRCAEAQLNTFRAGASEKLAHLENALREMTASRDRFCSELKIRTEQLDHMQGAVAAQESSLSRSKCEKMSLEARIQAMQGDVAEKANAYSDLQKKTEAYLEKIRSLEEQAREDASMRRKLHNAIQELKGNIRVFCRVRPLLEKELGAPEASVAKQMFDYNEKSQGLIAKSQPVDGKATGMSYPFKFDRVFGPSSDQETVFEEISQLVQSALDGYRVCIFAYGQTGSGKTHTMLGRRGDGDNELGMIPRSVRQVFETAKQLEKDQWSFELKASFLEIYNEQVRDLLTDSAATQDGKGKSDAHKIIFNHETKLSAVADLTVENVQNEEQVQRLVNKSMKNRATAATKANERSSRSHSVFRLYIEGRNASTGQKLNGLLNLIDLAGSERLRYSKAEGDRLRETKNINRSLSALGDVIAALANKDKHVPFRNSKLTYLLQDSLGGDCKTLMFVNISHALHSFNESLCSLRFAAKVNSCHVGTARRSAKIEM